MGKVVLFGNGPIARSAYYRLLHESSHDVVGFTVDKEVITDDTLFDLPVIPFDEVESVFPPDQIQMHIAVGYIQLNQLRAERYYESKQKGYEHLNIVGPRAIIAVEVEIGDNCSIGDNTIISSSTQIGNNVFIGAGSFVGHDTHIDDHCFIGDHVAISGSVKIGEYSFIGTNATVRNKIAIARECVIGAGAVILQDSNEKEVYMAAQAELLPISSDNLSVS